MLGIRSAISVVRNLHLFQQRCFLKKSFLAYPIVQKKFKSSDSVLEQYIQRGKALSKNPSESLRNLEDLIKGYSESEIYSKLLSSKEYKDCGTLDQFFIALALPSLTGKTQMAFNIRSKRPLYFALETSQEVNRYFGIISLKLKTLMAADFIEAQETLKSDVEFKAKYDEMKPGLDGKPPFAEMINVVTLEYISDFLCFHKFKSLGFLAALVKECEKLYTESTNDGWMRFFANANNEESFESLNYEPISLIELRNQKDVYKLLLEKYFIFIDEFSANPGIVIFRNFCRFLKIPCVLASTNSKIVNLVGASFMTGSGSSLPSVFCAVLPRLSTLSDGEIEQFFNEEINYGRFLELARNISENEERRMSLLLQFFKDQAKKTRPGVALYLFDALKRINETNAELKSLKVDFLIQQVIQNMVYSILFRKNSAFKSLNGMFANISLLGGNTFDSKYTFPHKSDNNGAFMIDNHFFYLKNPRTDSKSDEPYLLFRQKDMESKVYTHPVIDEELSIQCYFDQQEELLKLVCLFAPRYYTPSGIVNTTIGRKSLVLDSGKELEVTTFAAFLQSSHYDDKEKSVFLEGVGMMEFLKNLLTNLTFRKNHINLKFDDEHEQLKDDHILTGSVVPCLYIANHDWPAEIKAIFDPKESSFRLGQYTRTSDISEIDATVDVIDKDGRNCLGVIECKNRNKAVGKTDYTEIIKKSFKFAKVKRIDNFLNTLRPIIQPNMIESFEELKKFDLRDPNFSVDPKTGKSIKSSAALVQNFEDSTKFQVVKSKLKNYIKEDDWNEFGNLLKNLDGLETTSPLVHFLICQSCVNLKSLKNAFPGRKINCFRFTKGKDHEYEMIKAINPIHKEPEMVAFIIETDVINNKTK